MELAHVKREFNSPADFLASKALQGDNVHVSDVEGLQQLRDLNKLQRSAVQQSDSTRAEINAEPETNQQESAPSSVQQNDSTRAETNAEPETDQQESAPSCDARDDSAEADGSDDSSAHHSESRQHGAHDAAHLADAQDEAEQSDSTRAEINAEPETNQQESAPSCDARDDSAEADGSDDSSAHHTDRDAGLAAVVSPKQHKQYKRRVAQKDEAEVFVATRKQRATLAYRPQANGQQERSVQTVIRCVRAYVESPDQDDWEDAVYRLMFAINTSVDAVRRETPFFLVHGWDAKTTVSAMLAREPQGRDKLDAYLWRLQVQRQHEYAPYRISPWVHVSRLKPRVIDDERPAPTCIGELPEHDDWDAALLPEDSWLADESAGEYEVERILDVRWVASRTRTQARRREYLVQWAGYEEPTWVPATQLNCGRLLHEFDVSAKAKSRFAAMQASDESGEQA
ncbi:hypothetical protein ATCC90586_003330 [Pythium insidiosum]|nr:hypothetical protein ATCC90586_003330 [Pythium insidiosum]